MPLPGNRHLITTNCIQSLEITKKFLDITRSKRVENIFLHQMSSNRDVSKRPTYSLTVQNMNKQTHVKGQL